MHVDVYPMKRWLGALVLFAASACSGAELTEIIVVVDSNLAVPSELDSVRIAVTFPSGRTERDSEELDVEGGATLPLTLGLQYRGGEHGPVRVVAIGALSGTERVRASATTSFVPARSAVLRLHLNRDCVAVTCADGETCVDGSCVPDAPGDLPDATLCERDADCTGVPHAECATALCRAGLCVSAAIEGGCAAGEWCHPELGCRSACVASGAETCGNGVDDDCDGTIDCADAECEGESAGTCDCTAPTEAIDACGAGDSDCDGRIDEDCGCVEGWQIDAIDTLPVDVGLRASLALDGEGGLHVAYATATPDLRYSYHPPHGFWARTIVDETVEASATSRSAIAVGPDDRVHVAYQNASGALAFASRVPGGGWGSADLANADAHPSLIVDASGELHAVYRDNAGHLSYARRPAGGMLAVEPIDESVSVSATSMTRGESGAIHVAYRSGADLFYAARAPGGAWAHELVGTIGVTSVPSTCGIAVVGDVVHLVYPRFTSTRTTLEHASRAAAATDWTIVTVDDSAPRVGYDADLAAAPDGTLHASYVDYTNRDLRHAELPPGGAWTAETAEASRWALGGSSALLVGDDGVVHVVSHDQSNGDLRYARRAIDGSWSAEPVDVVGDCGAGPSIALDRRGHLHVAYYDETEDVLRHATRAPGPTWRTAVIAPIAPDETATIAVGPDGRAHIAWHDAAGLAYASGTIEAGFAAPERPDPSGAGHEPSIVWAPEGPIVAHHDAAGIRLSRRSAADGFRTEPFAAGGRYPALARATDGTLHLLFRESSGRARYASAPPGGALTLDVMVPPFPRAIDEWSALTLDGEGTAHVVARLERVADVAHISRAVGADWAEASIVDAAGSVGAYCDIAIDALGTAHVTYWDTTAIEWDGAGRPLAYRRDLKYARGTPRDLGFDWTRVTLDARGVVGEFASIEVTPEGYVYIAYFWESGAADALRLLRLCP